jgi:hypothetical protein
MKLLSTIVLIFFSTGCFYRSVPAFHSTLERNLYKFECNVEDPNESDYEIRRLQSMNTSLEKADEENSSCLESVFVNRNKACKDEKELTRAIGHILAQGADPNGPSEVTEYWVLRPSPLHYAAALGYGEIVKLLIKNGARFRSTMTDQSPLTFAIRGHYIEQYKVDKAYNNAIARGENNELSRQQRDHARHVIDESYFSVIDFLEQQNDRFGYDEVDVHEAYAVRKEYCRNLYPHKIFPDHCKPYLAELFRKRVFRLLRKATQDPFTSIDTPSLLEKARLASCLTKNILDARFLMQHGQAVIAASKSGLSSLESAQYLFAQKELNNGVEILLSDLGNTDFKEVSPREYNWSSACTDLPLGIVLHQEDLVIRINPTLVSCAQVMFTALFWTTFLILVISRS